MIDQTIAEAFPVSDYLIEEMEARGWSQADLASIIGRTPRDVSALTTGKVMLRPEMATLLGEAFGTGAEYWMNLETAYQAWKAGRGARDSVARRARLFGVCPVRLMQKRGWLPETTDLDALERDVALFFRVDNVADVEHQKLGLAARMACHYSAPVSASHRAWARRALNLAEAVDVTVPFSSASFDACLAVLKTMLEDVEAVRRVPRVLADHGIRLLIVEPLPKTRLDGACLWLDNKNPVIALSLRYERLDWFWFTLWHELAHVKARDGLNAGGVVDDCLVGQDASRPDEKPAEEQAADAFAAQALVDQEELRGFMARVGPLYSRQRIVLFAKRLRVHPALVVGQLQFRKVIDYSHSRDLLRDRLRDTVTANAVTDGWGQRPTHLR